MEKLPECAAWIARDDAGAIVGQVVAAIHQGAATLIQVTGTPGVQASLVAHVMDQPLTVMLVPPFCSELALGPALESYRGIRLTSADGQLSVHVVPINADVA